LVGLRNNKRGHLNYHKNEIMNLSPTQLVLKIYDIAILSCKLKDSMKVSKALVELISALDFEKGDIAIGLFKLYQYCMDIVKKGNFEEAQKILSELREAWLKVVKESQFPKNNVARVL